MSEGLCRCGCGKITPIAKRNRWDLGHIKGKHVPYLPSHNSARRTDPNQFWELVEVDEETGCWIRQRVEDRRDYGKASIEIDGRVYRKPHHVAWVLTHGPIPDGFFVLHKCDNHPCCNPDHLFLGTQADNMTDMAEKGRSSNSASLESRWSGLKKPIEEEANELRRRYTPRSPVDGRRALAREFGFSLSRVNRILLNKE